MLFDLYFSISRIIRLCSINDNLQVIRRFCTSWSAASVALQNFTRSTNYTFPYILNCNIGCSAQLYVINSLYFSAALGVAARNFGSWLHFILFTWHIYRVAWPWDTRLFCCASSSPQVITGYTLTTWSGSILLSTPYITVSTPLLERWLNTVTYTNSNKLRSNIFVMRS